MVAKVGLNFGEKIEIKGGRYQTFTDGLDVHALLGDLSWRMFHASEMETEDDTSKPQERDGSYPQISTGVVKWNDVIVFSPVQEESIFVSLVDMPGYAIEELDLKLGEAIELENPVITWSNVSGGVWKIFASALKRKGGQANQNQPRKEEKQG